MKIQWEPLKTEGLKNNTEKGVSAAYAALLQGELIVAGGANFPEKLSYEGGKKIHYKEIFKYSNAQHQWQQIGTLPKAAAYGASVPIEDAYLWVGGIAEKAFGKAYKITQQNGKIIINSFPELPVSIDNFAACSIGNEVFVAGGTQNGNPSNGFYMINAQKNSPWEKLPDYPGEPRIQPIMAAIEQNNKKYIYLLGGFFGGNAEKSASMNTEVLRYSTENKKWEKIAEQIEEKTQRKFSLGGATAMPYNNRYIICFGGVNYDVFLKALRDLNHLAHHQIPEAERKAKTQAYLKEYLTQPIEYYRFNTKVRVFDTQTNQWTVIADSPDFARAGATLVFKGNEFYLIQGEIKPGVRSPQTWKGIIIKP